MMFWRRPPRRPLSARQRVDLELLLRRTVHTIGESTVLDAQWVTDIEQLEIDSSSDSSIVESANLAVTTRLPKGTNTPTIKIVSAESIDGMSDYRINREVSGDCPKDDTDATVLINQQLIGDPLRLVMELANQHALHFWHQIEPQHPLDTTPLTTHLLPICCGFGFLASDASLYDSQWSLVGYSGWTLSRSGYYSAQEIGYAIATLASGPNALPDGWLKRLRADSSETAATVLKLQEQNQNAKTLFTAETIPSSGCDEQQLLTWLSGDSPDFALAAMEALLLKDRPIHNAEETTLQISNSNDLSMVHTATKVLAALASPSDRVSDRIHQLIKHRDLAIAIEATHSAVSLDLPLVTHTKRISRMIQRLEHYGQELLASLSRTETPLPSLVPVLCEQLDRAVQNQNVASDQNTAEHENKKAWVMRLAQCLRRHASNSEQAIEKHCRLTEQVLGCLESIDEKISPRNADATADQRHTAD